MKNSMKNEVLPSFRFPSSDGSKFGPLAELHRPVGGPALTPQKTQARAFAWKKVSNRQKKLVQAALARAIARKKGSNWQKEKLAQAAFTMPIVVGSTPSSDFRAGPSSRYLALEVERKGITIRKLDSPRFPNDVYGRYHRDSDAEQVRIALSEEKELQQLRGFLRRHLPNRQSAKEEVRASQFRLSLELVREIVNEQRPDGLIEALSERSSEELREQLPAEPISADTIRRVSNEALGTVIDFACRVQRLASKGLVERSHILSEPLDDGRLTFCDSISTLLQDNLLLGVNKVTTLASQVHAELAKFLSTRVIKGNWGSLDLAQDGTIVLKVAMPSRAAGATRERAKVTRLD